MRPNWSALRASLAASLLLFALVLAPLAFGRWTLEAFTYNKAVLLQATGLLLVAVAGPGRVGSVARQAVCDPATIGAALFGLSAIASTITSISPRTSVQGTPESFGGSGVILAYVVLFFAARAVFGSASGLRAVAGAATVAAAGAGVYAVLQMVGFEPMAWEGASAVGSYTRPFGTLGHANLLGAYLAMTLPLLLYLVSEATARGERISMLVFVLIVLLAATGVVASLSRAAWIAAACGVAVFAASRPRAGRWLALAAFVAVATVWLMPLAGRENAFGVAVATRLHGLGDGGGRYQIWRTAWLLFTDHPWLGSGLDTFQLVFGSRQTADYWQLEWGRTPSKAHNEILHILATQGLSGALALFVWAAGLARAASRAGHRCLAGERPALAAAAGGLVAFLVQVQFGFVEPGCGLLAACLAGILAGLGTSEEKTAVPDLPAWPCRLGAGLAAVAFAVNAVTATETIGLKQALAVGLFGSAVLLSACAMGKGPRRDGSGPVAASRPPPPLLRSSLPLRILWGSTAGGIAVIGLIEPYVADCACQSGELVRAGDAAAAFNHYRLAVALAPGQALYRTRLAAFAKDVADRESRSAGRLHWLQIARGAVDQATDLVPADAENHANRGRILAALTAAGAGDGDAALAEFDAAIARAPYNLIYRADAGQAALDCGRPHRAREYFENGLAIDSRCARLAMGLGAVALRDGQAAEGLAWLEKSRNLEWHDGAGCGRLPALLAVAHLAAHHAGDAERWAREALIHHPEDAVPHWVLAGAMELEGHKVEAAREYRTVLSLAPSMRPAREALRRLGEAAP
jgi:O-antigen ligase/tetratricopeptide (TPR) repeat protein